MSGARRRILKWVKEIEDPDIGEAIIGLKWLVDPYGGSCIDCQRRDGEVFTAIALRRILDEDFCSHPKRTCRCGVILISKYDAERTGKHPRDVDVS